MPDNPNLFLPGSTTRLAQHILSEITTKDGSIAKDAEVKIAYIIRKDREFLIELFRYAAEKALTRIDSPQLPTLY